MSILLVEDFLDAGTVRFDSSVPMETLVEIIRCLRASSEGDRFLDLHIRGAGDDGSRLIGFIYLLPDGRRKTARKARNRLRQFLLSRLGPSEKKPDIPAGVKDWCISTVEVTA